MDIPSSTCKKGQKAAINENRVKTFLEQEKEQSDVGMTAPFSGHINTGKYSDIL